MESELKTNILEDPVQAGDQGTPTRPFHVTTPKTWDEQTRQLEDEIRLFYPFEGSWQSVINNARLIIPEQLRPLFASGGVIAPSPDGDLLLFGDKHWQRYSRVIAKEIGTDPVHNDIARLTFSNMYRFQMDGGGTIDIPSKLLNYANITHEVAIIGLMYHAELHNKQLYLSSQSRVDKPKLAILNKLRLNKRK